MNLSDLSESFQRRFDQTTGAREKALAAARKSIRASANAIRAIHRGELDQAHRLMEESRAAIQSGREAIREDHPEVYFAGFLQDAQKEYAEARLTEVIVVGADIPGPDELEVELAPYLNGMAETIGEGRRAILDLLRRGETGESERILSAMEEMYYLLVSMDYPDAITGNLRRSTDVARSILERTRGDLSVALVQRNLQEALEAGLRRLEALPGPESRGPDRLRP
ncbi:MAG TPA: haloacid dehalogenase [Actinomycetota bacterium]|nr:haloacid dehalogenase [Actinomycetota bacterium]